MSLTDFAPDSAANALGSATQMFPDVPVCSLVSCQPSAGGGSFLPGAYQVANRGNRPLRTLGGYNLAANPTPGQALRIETLSREVQTLRREITTIEPNYARHFLTSASPQMPNTVIRGLEGQRNIYRQDLFNLTTGGRPNLVPGGLSSIGPMPNLPRDLRPAAASIQYNTRLGGMRSIRGQYTRPQVETLATNFLGQGQTRSCTRRGETWMSADGLRVVRLPTQKAGGGGVHPISRQPFSSTGGYQANFETYSSAARGPGSLIANVHVDAIP